MLPSHLFFMGFFLWPLLGSGLFACFANTPWRRADPRFWLWVLALLSCAILTVISGVMALFLRA